MTIKLYFVMMSTFTFTSDFYLLFYSIIILLVIFKSSSSLFKQSVLICTEEDHVERLSFHHKCGSHAAVINSGRTAHRPKYVLTENTYNK